MEGNNALDGVKVGDELVYSSAHTYDTIVKVEKVTKTMVVCANGSRFKLSNGYAVNGDAWIHSCVRKPKDADEVKRIKDELLATKYVKAIKESVDAIARNEKRSLIDIGLLKEIYLLVRKANENISETK
jgi:hypothetical protein